MNTFAMRRIQAGLLQEEAAARLSVDRSTIAKWETGKAKPRADKYPEIARVYGCPIGDLFNEDMPAEGVDKAV